jgi:hypothetical protein
MKTPSTISTHPDYKPTEKSINRAKLYAANAIFSSPILRKHYTLLAKSMKLRSPAEAAEKDYLEHEREFRELNRKL